MKTTIAGTEYQTASAFTLYKPLANGKRNIFGTYPFITAARRAQAALKPRDRRGSVIAYTVKPYEDPFAGDPPAPVEFPKIIEARRQAMYSEVMARIKAKAEAEAAEMALHNHEDESV